MMKATVSPLPTDAASTSRLSAAVFLDLFKARLTALVLLTTMVGFYTGSAGPVDLVLMIHTVLGTALVAAGAAALNQLMEREHDARMHRTENRPLPSGKLTPESVLIIGAVSSLTGLVYLAYAVNPLTSVLGAVTLGSYLLVYTPLKRVTSLNTAVGAIPGALPPLMGWTAACGMITRGGWSLFAILFFWQLPHFLSIAWMYREEYAKAGYAMLPVFDPEGRQTAALAVSHTLGLLPVSFFPFLFHVAGIWYLAGAFVLGLGFLACAIRFSRDRTRGNARRMFYASILYLPLLLGLMVVDKWS